MLPGLGNIKNNCIEFTPFISISSGGVYVPLLSPSVGRGALTSPAIILPPVTLSPFITSLNKWAGEGTKTGKPNLLSVPRLNLPLVGWLVVTSSTVLNALLP